MPILDRIKQTAPSIDEEELDNIIPELVEYYSPRIRVLAIRTYGPNNVPSIAFRAFKKYATNELHKGLYTYLFKSQHWRTGRDVNAYLLTCLNRLSDRLKSDVESTQKTSIPVCPACKVLKQKEYLRYEGRLLRCDYCMSEINRIERLETSDLNTKKALDDEVKLRRVFVYHTRRGYRCPDCERFIPDSYIQQHGVTCPYNDCCYFGAFSELELMAHPVGLASQHALSINSVIGPDSNYEFQDFFDSGEVNADVQIEVNQDYKQELDILNSVINSQVNKIIRNEGKERGRQKLLMYEAYQNMIKKCPEDMISYLVHRKHVNQPIQSRIFQEFIKLVENAMPFDIVYGKKRIEICSLLDPNLGLFLGISEFSATIGNDNIIPNNTIETYTGSRKLKNFGPCFIGMLINVEHAKTGESLLSEVDSYTFSQIRMKPSVSVGTPVKVTHFRIPSHYEMGCLVPLQRIRRRIVDSVYFRIHGKRREVR